MARIQTIFTPIRATRSLPRKPRQIPLHTRANNPPAGAVAVAGTCRRVAPARAHNGEQHSCVPDAGTVVCRARPQLHACQGGTGERRAGRRSRGVEAARPHVRSRGGDLPSGSGPGAGPPRPPLTSPAGRPPGPRGCDHGGAPPYTEAPCSARRRPAAPPPAGPACLYPSPLPPRLHCIGMHANCTHPIPGPPAAPINTRRRARQAFTYRIDHRSPDRFASAGRLSSSRQFYITT